MKKLFFIFSIVISVIGCKKNTAVKEATMQHPFSNILILGNSITYSAANASIGWNANWGMAASAPEKDYVHLLTTKFKQQNANSTITATNISAFETDYATYNFDTELKTLRDTKPDLVILRIGENVQSSFDSVLFAKRYQALITYLKTGNPDLKVLAAGSFWPDREYINQIMSRYSPYISLASLGNISSNYAFYLTNVSDAVKGHPGDKGMQGIADMIWAKVVTLNN